MGEEAVLPTSPKSLGFQFPAEFEPHSATWLLWPERGDTWREDARPAEETFTEFACLIAEVEPVRIGVSPERFSRARALLPPSIKLVEMAYNDAWVRDTGPTIVKAESGERLAVDWTFNAWGGEAHGLYQNWHDDDRVAGNIAAFEGIETLRSPLIQEGGGLHTDGAGTLFVTEECVLSPGRNRALGRRGAEQHLRQATGCEQVIWLPHGVWQDETTGHVDNLLHIPAPGLVLLTWCEDESDPQHVRSRAALKTLQEAQTTSGGAYDIRLLPHPLSRPILQKEAAGFAPSADGVARQEGDPVAASYANFYLCNGRIIVPLIDERTDEAALTVIADVLPDREIRTLPAREILLGGGGLHCITQQIPA